MTEFTTTTTSTFKVNCPGCDADHIVKVGVRNGDQRYRCKGCKGLSSRGQGRGTPDGR